MCHSNKNKNRQKWKHRTIFHVHSVLPLSAPQLYITFCGRQSDRQVLVMERHWHAVNLSAWNEPLGFNSKGQPREGGDSFHTCLLRQHGRARESENWRDIMFRFFDVLSVGVCLCVCLCVLVHAKWGHFFEVRTNCLGGGFKVSVGVSWD